MVNHRYLKTEKKKHFARGITTNKKNHVFEKDALTTSIPAQFIKRFNCDVVPVYIERLSGIRFKMTIFEPIKFEEKSNEKFITAQILSKSLENVYTIFETNLAMSKNDIKNKEASMEFLKYLTDIMEKYNIKLNQIIPGKKTSKGSLTNIPYDIHIVCDYEKLGEFINEIESSDRIILINELTIKNNIEKIKSNKKDQNISDQEIELEIQTVTINKSKEYNES